MKIPESFNSCITAYHEAGHAVVGYALGKRFRYISIIPDIKKEIVGCVLWHTKRSLIYRNLKGRLKAETEVMITCGGLIAENRALLRTLSTDEKNHDGELRQNMWLLDFLVCGTAHEKARDSKQLSYDEANRESQAYFDWLYLRTEKLLNEPKWWASVEMLTLNPKDRF